MSFDPYIHFQGNCRAAMTAYHEIFGGKLEIMDYEDAPEGPEVTEAMRGSHLVMHSTLVLGERMLFASDYPPGMTGEPQAGVTISHTAPSVEEAKRLFDLLVEGGETIMAVAPTFWSDAFGMLKDRFGTHWMVSSPWRQG